MSGARHRVSGVGPLVLGLLVAGGTDRRTAQRAAAVAERVAGLRTVEVTIATALLGNELTVRELAEALDLTVQHVGRDLRGLERAGWVARRRRRGEPDVWRLKK